MFAIGSPQATELRSFVFHELAQHLTQSSGDHSVDIEARMENSPALLDCLQSEIDAVRMRYEERKKVWEEMVTRIEELSRYRP